MSGKNVPSGLLLRTSLVFVLLGALAVLVVGVGVFYWRQRLNGLVESARKTPDDMNAWAHIRASGARALPYLVTEVQDALSRNDRQALVVWTEQLSLQVFVSDNSTHWEVLPDPDIPRVLFEDTQEAVSKKCAAITQWWQTEHSKYPPSWMFWRSQRLN